jgi:RHS repeat-associated protein
LNDSLNITGYSQVIKQTETDLVTGEQANIIHIIGRSKIAQITIKNGTEQELYFTFDGHGSTRVLTDLTGAIAELYAFDAYGNAIGFDPSVALTEFLYSGEQFDSKIGQQYLRQRYYDPATGRFNRLDPFFGNVNDPQSLHKYMYTNGDPANGIDPNGLMTVAAMVSSIGARIGTLSSNAATAFNAYKNVKTFADVFQLIKTIGLAIDRAHDTLNLIYDLISFDLSDFKELSDIKNQFDNYKSGSPLGAAKIEFPFKKISIKTGRGKLGRIFYSLGRSKQVSEFFGEIAAVGVAQILGIERVNIPVGYHGFDADV